MSELTGNEPDNLELHCPSCGSALSDFEQQTEVSCPVCNGQFVLAGHLCPVCLTYHQDEHAACRECGSPLIRLCRKCQATNWTGSERCVQCGETIDLLSHLESKTQRSTADRLGQQMVAAKELNEAESTASDRRMAELMAIEEARQAELRRQQAKRERQERNMLIVVFVAVVLFLLAMITLALLDFLG